MDAEQSLAASGAVMRTVRGLIAREPRVGGAFMALCARGMAQADAEVEIALAFVCCLFETSRGHGDRFEAVCSGLGSGMSVEQMFPDTVSDSRRTQRTYERSGAKAI